MSDWELIYEGYEPGEEGLREALCALGNGYLVTRGAAPESNADDVHYPGTYAAGIYNRLESEIDGTVVENECLVNLPNWLCTTFRIGDGPWFDVDAVEIDDYVQELSVRRGVLVRRCTFRDGQGRTTVLTQRRFVHMADRHVCGLETTITALDWSGRLRLRSGLDGSVENSGVERYRMLAGNHLDVVGARALCDDALLLEVETKQSHIRVAEAARHRLCRAGMPVEIALTLVEEGDWIGHEVEVDVAEGEQVTLEKLVTVFTSRDRAISEPGDAAARMLAVLGGFEDLLGTHVLAWNHLWERFHIDLDEPDDALGVIRLHLFHLLATVSPNSTDLDVGVPARGLHGEAYRGHILWDELFVFPILNLRTPLLARSLLGYRYRRLREARRAAAEAGYRGAMYPWQSGSDGREESQVLHLNPRSGRWVRDETHRQRHISAAVAYNVWQYYQATGDREFLGQFGAEILLEIARFWGSAAEYDRTSDRYVIRGVVGPDEFHTRYPGSPQPGIDNNAYTNVMAAWVLQRALDLLDLLHNRRRDELVETLALRPEERDCWEELARKLFVPFHDGVISQFEGYEALEELDWDAYRQRYDDLRRLDRILEAEGDDVNRYKASKQADVLMLFYLLSADELRDLLTGLGYELTAETIPRTIDYYMPRTSHGSTLSAVVHAWVLARGHREQALEYFLSALASDVTDIQGGTTPEGIHLAAMTGSVDLLQRCFTGVETRAETLWLNPYWPEELGTLEFTIRYREHPLTVRVTGDQVRVSAGPTDRPPIRVGARDEWMELGAGESAEFPLRTLRAPPGAR